MATHDNPTPMTSPGGGEQVLNELMNRAKKSRRYRPSSTKDVSFDHRNHTYPELNNQLNSFSCLLFLRPTPTAPNQHAGLIAQRFATDHSRNTTRIKSRDC